MLIWALPKFRINFCCALVKFKRILFVAIIAEIVEEGKGRFAVAIDSVMLVNFSFGSVSGEWMLPMCQVIFSLIGIVWFEFHF